MAFTVAIDGPAAAGKGTIGRAVAEAFGFAHLDTGLLYRAVGVQALEDGRGVIDPHWAAEIARRMVGAALERDDLRTARAGQAASKVAAMPEVRAALLAFQKDFARRDGGAVLDGRDIGTVICPEAEAKLYVTASDAVRAGRRHRELGRQLRVRARRPARPRRPRHGARRGADACGTRCALARHHRLVYRRGRRRGGCLREESIRTGRALNPRRKSLFLEPLGRRPNRPVEPTARPVTRHV
jgi:CMP/dCMP kinase